MDDKTQSYKDYMVRISNEKIPVYEPSFGDEEIRNLTKVIESNWVSEATFTRDFEECLSGVCEREYALAFNNATAALITGMKSLGLDSESEVIVPSFAHSADPNSVSASGAKLVFADVEYETMCLSIRTIKASITNKTKAVLFISAYGNAEGIDEIEIFCKQNNLYLINDCAPALFGKYKNRSIASFGDFSVLSFFADKTITTGEGGMLLTNNFNLISECNIYKHDGRKERGHDLIERRGFNYRITEFQSAVGVAQFKKGPYFAKRKQEIFKKYNSLLQDLQSVRIFDFNKNNDAVPHRIVAFVNNSNTLIKYLSDNGIGARTLFKPMHSQPCYEHEISCPNSQKLFNEGIELPSFPGLSEMQLETITKAIIKFYNR